MSGTAAFKVLRAVLYTVYVMLASALAVACGTAFIHRMVLGKEPLRPLTVIEDVIHFVGGDSVTVLTSLNDRLEAESILVSLIAGIAFVAGLAFFGRDSLTSRPVWFGAPTAFIATAVLWEVMPRLGPWIALGALVIVFLIAGFVEAFEGPCYQGETYMGRTAFNWFFNIAGLVMAPINLVHELKERRAPEARAAPA